MCRLRFSSFDKSCFEGTFASRRCCSSRVQLAAMLSGISTSTLEHVRVCGLGMGDLHERGRVRICVCHSCNTGHAFESKDEDEDVLYRAWVVVENDAVHSGPRVVESGVDDDGDALQTRNHSQSNKQSPSPHGMVVANNGLGFRERWWWVRVHTRRLAHTVRTGVLL